jgi:hypothetical protein
MFAPVREDMTELHVVASISMTKFAGCEHELIDTAGS